MIVSERTLQIPLVDKHKGLLKYLSKQVLAEIAPEEVPLRFVVTKTDQQGYHCELGVLSELNISASPPRDTLFKYNQRVYENAAEFNAVLLIPTGIGAEIGGHSGDGGAVARLLASACDNLITHPNVVNASDINEAPENTLYVEGSVLTRLLMGTVSIQKVHSNRVLLIIDQQEESYYHDSAINSASAARVTLGLDCPLVIMMGEQKINMSATFSPSGRAVGHIENLEYLYKILKRYRSEYDAVALATVIDVTTELTKAYFTEENLVNPWGGVEAMLTHAVSLLFNLPSAHSPMLTEDDEEIEVGLVDPRKAAEVVSVSNLHCILKGLHKSPRIIDSLIYGQRGILSVADISCLVIPYGCVGLPTLAALEQGISVIAVKENKNLMRNRLEALPFDHGKLFVVDNYLEAVGVMNALKAGVTPNTVRRPIAYTSCKVAR